MKKNEEFNLALSESKDHLVTLDDSITRTRNKVFYLIGVMFASITFLADDFFSGLIVSLESLILYIFVISTIVMLIIARKELSPKKQGFNGITPDNFERLRKNKHYNLEELMLNSYQQMINTNVKVLKELSGTYKFLFKGLIVTGIISLLLCSVWTFLPKSFIS